MRIDIQNAILLLLCLVLLLSVFSLSASAVEWVDFSEYVIPYAVNSAENAKAYGKIIAYAYNQPCYFITDSNNPVYYFYVSGENKFYFATNQLRQYVRWYSWLANGNLASTNSMAIDTNLYQGFYFKGVGASLYTLEDMPTFSTLEEAQVALTSWIADPTPPASPTSLQYSLPPGNAIYIQVPQGASYTLKTRMPESVLGSNHYPGNNQAITLVQSLPTGGTAPSSPLIPWQQDGALSVLGLSRNASYQGTNASSGYLCIVNPLYYSGTANGPYEFLSNGSIDITIDQQTGFVVYPLDSTLGFTSGLGINVDTTILDNPYTGGIDPDTGEIIWQDSNGGSTAPTTGGGNLVSTSETIFDFLRNIGDEISTFLKGPIQAIQVVVSAIRDFLSSFTQLYMWLPSPVYNLITSALMIALTIGVIKIFV